MNKLLFLIASLFLLSCSKQEFAPNKGSQISAITPVVSSSLTNCAQKTLVSPKVDILLLWDNSTSAGFINPATKNSFNQLITSVSEKFDYHILSAPLISSNVDPLYQALLVVKTPSSVTGVESITKTKEQAAAALGFSPESGSKEAGALRAYTIINTNRSNGIFRNNAYTIIVVMSNGDDTSCEVATNYNICPQSVWESRLQVRIDNLLCLRGNFTNSNCVATTPLNSTMMRFINISPLTSCSSGLGNINSRYRKIAKVLYETPYTNGWPLPLDDIHPFTSGGVEYPDSYDLCSISFNNIFDSVNTAIKQTLIQHVYDYWPVAEASESVDPDTLRVARIGIDNSSVNLVDQTKATGTKTTGFKYIGNQTNLNTRIFPTRGEPFSGKMIQLLSTPPTPSGSTLGVHDQVIYPECLQVTYSAVKAKYGYIYLTLGEPYVPTIEVRLNGVVIPQNNTNGWEYMGGPQFIAALDNANFKIANFPYANPVESGYIIQLHGTAQFTNDAANNVSVYYTAK